MSRERPTSATSAGANRQAATKGAPAANDPQGNNPRVDILVWANGHADVLERNVHAALPLGLLNDLGVDATTIVHPSMAHAVAANAPKVLNILIALPIEPTTNDMMHL